MNKSSKLLLLPLLLACLHSTVFAGGSIATHSSGVPVVYANGASNIVLNYDLGALGSRTNDDADILLNQALSLWNNVSTSTINISQGTDLDLNETDSHHNETESHNEELLNNFTDGINPVVFDNDGEIIDSLFGEGAKDYVLGFAGSSYNVSTGIYIEGQAVINGTIAISDNELITLFAHEIGHFFGLDHTQLDSDQGLITSNYPIMYPTAYREQLSLHEDDIAAVSKLYPAINFDATYGTLSGSFHQDGEIIRGANIWVQNISTSEVFSTVSDYFNNNSGDFSLNLPAGIYTVHAESIQVDFVSGRSVGPYSETIIDISFQSPHPLLTPISYGSAGNLINAQVTISSGNTRHVDFNLSGIIVDIDGDSILDLNDSCANGESGWTSNTTTDFDSDGCLDATEDLDDDNDTLFDIYETDNDLNPFDATGINGATGDADTDGFTNFEEQVARSAANDVSSNPGYFNFSSATTSVNEDAGTGSIDITRTGGAIGIVSVLCFSSDINATEGIDYTNVNSRLSWNDGEATNKVCSFDITPDSDIEGDETFQLDLSDPTGGAKLGTP